MVGYAVVDEAAAVDDARLPLVAGTKQGPTKRAARVARDRHATDRQRPPDPVHHDRPAVAARACLLAHFIDVVGADTGRLITRERAVDDRQRRVQRPDRPPIRRAIALEITPDDDRRAGADARDRTTRDIGTQRRRLVALEVAVDRGHAPAEMKDRAAAPVDLRAERDLRTTGLRVDEAQALHRQQRPGRLEVAGVHVEDPRRLAAAERHLAVPVEHQILFNKQRPRQRDRHRIRPAVEGDHAARRDRGRQRRLRAARRAPVPDHLIRRADIHQLYRRITHPGGRRIVARVAGVGRARRVRAAGRIAARVTGHVLARAARRRRRAGCLGRTRRRGRPGGRTRRAPSRRARRAAGPGRAPCIACIACIACITCIARPGVATRHQQAHPEPSRSVDHPTTSAPAYRLAPRRSSPPRAYAPAPREAPRGLARQYRRRPARMSSEPSAIISSPEARKPRSHASSLLPGCT